MSDNRESPSLMDILVVAISPALIMAMVGSLVFFLVDIFYVGKYEERLNYTLFFFVFGMVLVSRISIEMGSGRAMVYGLALGAVVWIAMQTFLQYAPGGPLAPIAGLINLILMGIVWWAAHKLTWDCTFIDERREASDRGLLAAAGLEKTPGTRQVRQQTLDPDVVTDVTVEENPNEGWWERLERRMKERREKPHTPGLWVIYFSLAALPIFGLGQSLIPAEDDARRGYAFRLMLIYVASGMGLLLTTSFLGIRRYLIQRGMPMPMKMTGVWLALGAALIFGFLVVGAILPRPYSETPIIDFAGAGSEDRDASKNAIFDDSAGKGEGDPGEQSKAGKGQNTADKGEPGGKGDGKGEKGSGEKQGEKGSGGDQKGDKSGNGDKSGEGTDSEADRNRDPSQHDDDSGSGSRSGEESESQDSSEDGGSSGSSSPTSRMGQMLQSIGTFLKWVVFGLIILLILLFLFRGNLGWLEAWNRFWARLFGKGGAAAEAEAEAAAAPPPPMPFSAYSDPFMDGSAHERSLEDLTRYSFAALEAWARDHGSERRPDETPLEFASRLGDEFPKLEGAAGRLAGLYARIAYAGRGIPAKGREMLEQFWLRVGEMAPVDRRLAALSAE